MYMICLELRATRMLVRLSVLAAALCLGVLGVSGADTDNDYDKYEAHVKKLAQNETFVQMYNEQLKLFYGDNTLLKSDIPEFKCNKTFARGKAKPTSVHQLSPTDVNVVAALGDSITAGTGITASTVIGLLRQDRGLSWSIGGDSSIDTEETLPNMLRVFNEEVKGFSKSWGPVWMASKSRFNIAHPGDKSEHIPGQAQELVKRMTSDSSVNFVEDWKVITIFIGGNDLCKYCTDKKKYSAERYVANLQAGLDILHQNVPRAFINVVQVLDVAIVKRLNANLVCDALHIYGCHCAAFPWNSKAEAEIQEATDRYRQLTRELIESGRYDTRDDFTVVEQPFFSKTAPPNKADGNPDLSYFAPDCFHLSLKGHRAASEALWNNMIEPQGKKRTKWTPGEQVECPSNAVPYFYTRKNSGQDNTLSNNNAGLGAINDNDDNVGLGASPNQDMQTDGKRSSTGNQDNDSPVSMTSLFIGLGIVGAVAVVVIGLIVRKRRGSRLYQEEKSLLSMEQCKEQPHSISNTYLST